MAVVVADVVLAYAGTKEGRPCVVLRWHPVDGVLVAVAGTGSEHPGKRHVTVAYGSEAWKAMGLTKTTYFYATVVRLRPEQVTPSGRCPPEILAQLRELVGIR